MISVFLYMLHVIQVCLTSLHILKTVVYNRPDKVICTEWLLKVSLMHYWNKSLPRHRLFLTAGMMDRAMSPASH